MIGVSVVAALDRSVRGKRCCSKRFKCPVVAHVGEVLRPLL